MKRTTLTLSLIALFTLLFARNNGVGTALGQDRTGSPVGLNPQCGACHAGGSSAPAIVTRMLDTAGNQVTHYEPGQVYTYEVELTASSGLQYGFQTVGLISANNTTAGNLTALSPNAKVITMNGRKYGEQISKSVSGLFQMQWTAPATNVGNVTFYAAGVSVNNNGSSSGDRSSTAAPLVLGQSPFASAEDNDQLHFEVFPNPCTDYLQIQPGFSGPVHVQVYDLSGRSVYTQNYTASSGQPSTIDVSELTAGSYLVEVRNTHLQKSATTMLIKK